MYEFEFKRPTTIDEAIKLLSEDGAEALGGGQTLIPTLKQRLAMPEALISLGAITEMQEITAGEDGTLFIGGGAIHAAVAAATKTRYPALAMLAGNIGDPAVRSRGTIGGSLANNDPSADYPAAVLASNATIVTNHRKIAADEFFDGLFETALEEGEIITGVEMPVPAQAAYAKFDQPASRFALVGVFVARGADGVRVAVTGASEDGVYRWDAAEAALDADFSAAALDPLTVAAEGMIADIHGSADYRAHLVKVMTARAVKAACDS